MRRIPAGEVVEPDAGGAKIDEMWSVEMPGDDLQALDRKRGQIRFGAGILRPEERRSAIHRTRIRVSRNPVRIAGVLTRREWLHWIYP